MSRCKLTPTRVNPVLRHPSERRVSLDGQWGFRLDPEDKGIDERWFDNSKAISDPIEVPGCWQGQGFGHDGNDTVWDFRFETRVFRATYKGTGWYAKSFSVPNEWKEQRLWLNFGGVHPSAEIWVNGERIGENTLPFVPFAFEVTDVVRFDDENQLVVRIHEKNRLFGLVYNWEGNWSGLYRSVEIVATGHNLIQWCATYPNVDTQAMEVVVRVEDIEGASNPLLLKARAYPTDNQSAAVSAGTPVTSREARLKLDVPSPNLWSQDNPSLYRVDVELMDGTDIIDARSHRIGFVKLSTNDANQILINNEPYYMRGSGDHISCPDTGSPDTDRDRWRKKLKTLREYGYNYVRCTSFVFPPEYLDVADEVGLLVQSGMGMIGGWGGHTHWHSYQWPRPTPDNYPILKEQWDMVVMRDVNHPSANIYCMSNEHEDPENYKRIAWQCYHDTKAIKPTSFVIYTDGGYRNDMPGDFVNLNVTEDTPPFKPKRVPDKAHIAHEFRWWSSFPDVLMKDRYTGAIRPYAIDIATEAAARNGLTHILPEAAHNSQRLQFVEAKGKMEMCRRDHPQLTGICHFNGTDLIPSPQGIMNQFYEDKYTNSRRWIQTNGDTVIMSSLGFDDRVFASGDVLHCSVSVSDFSHAPMKSPLLEWQLVSSEKTLASGELHYEHKPFAHCPIGDIQTTIPVINAVVTAKLEVRLRDGDRITANSWDLWLLPTDEDLPSTVCIYGTPQYSWIKTLDNLTSVSADDLSELDPGQTLLTERLDSDLTQFVKDGGVVLLAATEGIVRPHRPNFDYIKYFFTPPANYPPYEDGQNGTIIQDHPVLGAFPHEGFADLQFFRMIEDAPPIDLAPFELNQGDPVIRVIHRYPVCHPLGYLVVGRYGKGTLIISALDLDQSYAEARYLLRQICEYACSAKTANEQQLSEGTMQRIIQASSIP